MLYTLLHGLYLNLFSPKKDSQKTYILQSPIICMKLFSGSANPQKAQASMETLLLIGGVILIAIIVLVVLLTLMGSFQSNTSPDVQDVQQGVQNLG